MLIRIIKKYRLSILIITWWFLACCGKATNAISNCTKYIPYDSVSPICVAPIPEEGVVGWCYHFSQRTDLNYIIIDVDKLTNMGSSIEFTIMHEILHCDFGLDHKPTEYLYDGCAKWIIGTYYPASSTSNRCFNKHEAYYRAQFEEFKSHTPTLF
jgi:hypothetical protein